MNDWLDRLRDEIKFKSEIPPKGYVCARDVQKRFGYKSPNHALRLLKKMVATGKVHEITIRIKTETGCCLVKYFGPTPKPKQRPHPRPVRMRNG